MSPALRDDVGAVAVDVDLGGRASVCLSKKARQTKEVTFSEKYRIKEEKELEKGNARWGKTSADEGELRHKGEEQEIRTKIDKLADARSERMVSQKVQGEG
jgi:hypothetical protein